MLKMIEKYKSKLPKDEVLVRSRVKLSGWNECRVGECSIGNLLADAMAYARAKMLTKTNFPYATDASIAFLNSDGIRASIDKKSDGLIRQKDIRLVLPFKTKVFVVEMKGSTIRKNLEHSGSQYDDNEGAGGILQMAGVKVTYNIKKPPGKRLGDDVQVLCANCEVPTYEPLNDNQTYKVIVNNYLYGGGGGYKFKENNSSKPVYEFEGIDVDLVTDYLRNRGMIYPSLEGRIVINEEEERTSGGQIIVGQFITILLFSFILFYLLFY